MRIIAFIEDPEVIKKILKHLDLWNLKARPPPRADAPPNNIEPHLIRTPSYLHLPAIALAQARRAGPTITSM
ncbi:MAG: hypothetical protein KAV87_10805 [Desulfobacteraceae bacterium]|nr:hypothetical protein [Desulfobacteraceae bacterium]